LPFPLAHAQNLGGGERFAVIFVMRFAKIYAIIQQVNSIGKGDNDVSVI
jgi:hypothetical protein